jgi:nitroimidazol reductase NimA-like FMN-containing flavoprotein (pyridoxamine 5'-phosphate oxidase superfamily)
MTTERSDGVSADAPVQTYTRRSDHARYDAQAINSAIDEALISHVGYIDGGEPVVIPTIHSRINEDLFLRIPSDSRLAQLAVGEGISLCVTVTLVDGLVLARSEVNHVLNYRSVVARGRGALMSDEGQKQIVLDTLVEQPGSRDRRRPRSSPLSQCSGCPSTTSP